MSYCPVCGNDNTVGAFCTSCGYDKTSDYEQYRTLSPSLPEGARSIFGLRQGEVAARSQNAFVCPQCGGNHFTFLMDELKLECVDCGEKMPLTNISGSKPESEIPRFAENKAELSAAPPAPPQTATLQSRPERPEGKKQLPAFGQNELTAIICTHCGLVNPDTNFACDHCAKRLWRDNDPGAPQNVFLYGWEGVVRRYDHIKVVAPSPPQMRSAPPSHPSASAPEPVTYPVISNQSHSTPTKPMSSWGRTKEDQEKIDQAYDILLGKSK